MSTISIEDIYKNLDTFLQGCKICIKLLKYGLPF